MRLIYGNLFKPDTYRDERNTPLGIKPSALVISTNGFVKKTGEAVMGRGCAKAATDKWPQVSLKLGKLITKYGNHVFIIDKFEEIPLVSFPVKPIVDNCNKDKSNIVKHMQNKFQPGQSVPGWACIASSGLIHQSALELCKFAHKYGWGHVIMPRVGAGAGEIPWDATYNMLNKTLDNFFYAITFKR